MNHFGENLRFIIEHRGLTEEEFGNLMKCETKLVEQWIQGELEPGMDNLVKISSWVRVPIDTLIKTNLRRSVELIDKLYVPKGLKRITVRDRAKLKISQKVKLKEFEKIFDIYEPDWFEFINWVDCFITHRGREIVPLFVGCGNYNTVATKLGLSRERVRQVMVDTEERMRKCLPLFLDKFPKSVYVDQEH